MSKYFDILNRLGMTRSRVGQTDRWTGDMVVSFPLLDVIISCAPINVSAATRQLFRCHAFNLNNLGLFGIELKAGPLE